MKNNNKGIARKDLHKIATTMRQWQQEQATKKQVEKSNLDEELQKDVESIQIDQVKLTEEVRADLENKSSSREMKLPQVRKERDGREPD